jgi:drug/metabolite transporter (DMT)-like permease
MAPPEDGARPMTAARRYPLAVRPIASVGPATVTATPSSETRIGIAAALAAAIIYGAAYPATSVALRSFSPIGIAGLSCTLALVIVVGLASIGVLPSPAVGGMTRARLVRLAVLSLFGGILFIVGVNVAVAIAGPTITGFVAPLYAVFGTLFAVPFLGERIRTATILAFVLAFVGTALLAGAVPAGAPAGGVVLALISAAMFGLYVVLARRWGAAYRLDGTLVTIANLIGRGPVLLVAAYLLDPGGVVPANPDPAAIFALLTIVFGSSTSGNLLLMASVRRIPAGRVSGALLLTPVASAVIAVVVLDERLSTGGIVGAVLILAGMALASGVTRLRLPARDPILPGPG